LVLVLSAASALGQSTAENNYYSRVNTFGIFGAYSNDSSHILMGIAENRRLLEFGATYSRRLLQNHVVNWQYNAELLPVALESDPLLHTVITYILPNPSPPLASTYAQAAPCRAGSGTVSFMANGRKYEYTYADTCSRQWTIGEAMSPVGFQWNFLPRNKLQPVIVGHGGYMYSTHPIPIENAGSFNFTFDLGAGFELYRSKHSSIRAEYRYHHISNHYTASANPGIDNGVFQVTYSFGR
jgi:hypothetical protein